MERLYRILLAYFLVISSTIPSAFPAPLSGSPGNGGGFMEDLLSHSQNCRYPVQGILKDPAFVSQANKTCEYTQPVPTICLLVAGAVKNICASGITQTPTKEDLTGLLNDENLSNEDGAKFCQRLNYSVPLNYQDRSMVDSFTRLGESKKSECMKVCAVESADDSGDINGKVKINPVCLLGAKVFQDLIGIPSDLQDVATKSDATSADAATNDELPVSSPGVGASSPAGESVNVAGITAPEVQNDATGSEKSQPVAPVSSTSKILPAEVSPNSGKVQSGSTENDDDNVVEVTPKLASQNSNVESGAGPEIPTLSQGPPVQPVSESTGEDPVDITKDAADKRNGGGSTIESNPLTQGPVINGTVPKPANNSTSEGKPEEPASPSGVAPQNGSGTDKVNVTAPASASSEQGSPVELTGQSASVKSPPSVSSSTKAETGVENDSGDDNVGQISRNDQDVIISPKPQGNDGGEVDDDDKVSPEMAPEVKKPSSSSSKTDAALDQDYDDAASNIIDGFGSSSAQQRPQIQTEGRRPEKPNLYNYDTDSDSGFLGHALIFVVISGVLWILFRNRKRVIAIVVEGRRPAASRPGRRRSSSGAGYRKLENNFD